MAYENESAEFWASASRIASSANDKVNEKEVTLYLKTVGDLRKQSMIDYLASITTLTDAKYDNKKATLSGVWRAAGAGWSGNPQGYILTLREGWATSVLTASLPNDECMVQAGSDTRSDARTYTFMWRNIAAGSVNACVQSIRNAGSFANPTIQGEEKTGIYVVSEITPQQQADGSYWIAVACLKAITITAIGDFAVISPLRKDIHDIENPFGLEGGYAVHVGKKPTDGIVLTYRALSVASRAVILALTDAALQGLLSAAEKLKYEFVKRELTEDTGNTLTLSLVYQYIPLSLTTPEIAARYVELRRFNQSGKIMLTRSWPRIDPSVADSLITTNANSKVISNTVTDPMADGKTYSGEWLAKITSAPETDNDGIRIVQELILAGDQKLDVVTGKDPDHLIREFYRWDYSTASVEAFLAETGIEEHIPKLYNWNTPETGKLKNVRVSKNADYSFDIYAVFGDVTGLHKVELCPTIAPDPNSLSGTPITVRDSNAAQSERAFGWNMPIAYLRQIAAYYNPTPAVVNQRNSFRISRQTEHVFDFDATRETFTTIDSGWIVVEDNTERTVSIRSGKYILAASLADDGDFGKPATFPAGTMYEPKFDKNELGSFDGQIVKIVVKNVTSTKSSKSEAKTVTVTEESESVAIIDTNAATGTIRTVEQSPTRAGKVKTSDTVITPKDQTSVSAEHSAARVTTETLHTEWDEITDLSAAAGTIRRVEQSPTEAGNMRTRDTVVTPKDQEAAGGAASLLESESVEIHTEGSTVSIPSASQNVRVEVLEDPTEAGNKKTKKVTLKKKPWDSGEVVVADDGVLKVTQQIFKNQTSPTAAGTNQEAALQDNDLGGYNEVLRKRSLSASAAGTKGNHASSVVDWDVQKYNLRTPTWSTSTNSDEDSYVTGYNIWMASMSRSRTITTTITKEYVTTEPGTLSTSAASAGAEGAGTSYFKDSRPVREGIWEVTTKTVTTSPWSAWGNKTLTFLYWMQTTVGTGS